LMNNRYIFLVLALYFFMVSYTVYDIYSKISGSTPDVNLFEAIVSHYFSIISVYGMLIGIVVGFMAVSSERRNHALNTLIVKPVYRDMIINGKFIGSLGYLFCIFFIVTILYISELLLFYGNSFISIFPEIFAKIIPLFVASLLYVLIFFFLSMLLSIIIKGQSYALILSIFLWEVFKGNILGGISTILSSIGMADYRDVSNFISGAIPFTISDEFNMYVQEHSTSIISIFFPPNFELVKLILYLVIMVVLCYIAFLRSDIS